MGKRPRMKTTKKQIVDWCARNISELDYPVDAAEMGTHCFRCACRRDTERAHIVPWAVLGYDKKYDSPEYYRLLCSECHAEAPNVAEDVTFKWPNHHSIMDKWIKDSSVISEGMYEVFWDRREILQELYSRTGVHGFEPTNQSTHEWVAREFLSLLSKPRRFNLKRQRVERTDCGA